MDIARQSATDAYSKSRLDDLYHTLFNYEGALPQDPVLEFDMTRLGMRSHLGFHSQEHESR